MQLETTKCFSLLPIAVLRPMQPLSLHGTWYRHNLSSTYHFMVVVFRPCQALEW